MRKRLNQQGDDVVTKNLNRSAHFGFGTPATKETTFTKNTEVTLSVLSNGKVFKNYRDLCQHMNWRVYSAGSKSYIAQFKALSSVCNWRKDVDENGKKLSNKIIIEEVYAFKKATPDKRKTSDKSYLTRLVSRRILDVIDENQKLHKAEYHGFQNCLYLTMGSLYAQIGLVNETYAEGMKNQKSLSHELGCPVEHVNDFYNCVSANLKKTVDAALKRLYNQRLVYSVYTKRLVLRDDDAIPVEANVEGTVIVGEMMSDEMNATERQRKFIFECEHQALRQYGLYNLPDVYTRDSRFRKRFFEQVVKNVNEKAEQHDPFDYEIYVLRRLKSYYNVLELSYTEEYINREINRLGEMSQEEREVLRGFVDLDALEECLTPFHPETRQMINQEHMNRLALNAKQRHQKAIRNQTERDEKYQRSLHTYSENMGRIAEKVIEQKQNR